MDAKQKTLLLYGAIGSGAIAVEAALTLLGIPYDLVEGETWSDKAARQRVAGTNAMRQIPTLVWPNGEVMILIRKVRRHSGG